MSRGKVIVVTLNEPYPFGAVTGRWYYVLLKELRRRGYQVRCLSVVTKEEWGELAQQAIAPFGIQLSLYPVSLNRNWLTRKWRTLRQPFSYTLSDALRRNLEAEVRNGYDVLHLEGLWSGYLSEGSEHRLVTVHHLGTLDLDRLKYRFNPRFTSSRQLTF